MDRKSIGQVKTYTFECAGMDNPLPLESGRSLGPIEVTYETYGTPNDDRSNAILICHALSGDAHAAGYHHPHDRNLGWWDGMIGPDKAFDTNKYWVICSNVIGGCKGSTGPASTNPETGKAYGLDFPMVTIRDMVDVQQRLVAHLGIKKLYSVVGGSMGGFQVLEWALRYPHMVRSAVCIASAARLSAQGIAFNAVGRNAITKDSAWTGGHYEGDGPENGLAIARMIGHITYLSELLMDSKFGRRLQSADRLSYDFSTEFAVESYLNYKGNAFTRRFDANSYLYMTKAMDYFDIERSYGPLKDSFAEIQARLMIVAYSTDWLFPSEQSKDLVHALLTNNKDVSFIEIDSPYGHDAFLVEEGRLANILRAFLTGVKIAAGPGESS